MHQNLVFKYFPGPVKERKRYLEDGSVPVPKRTLRWQKKQVKLPETSTQESSVTCRSIVEFPKESELSEVVEDDMTMASCGTEVLSETVSGDESFSSSDSDSFSDHDSLNEISSECYSNLSESDFSELDNFEKDCKQAETDDVNLKKLSAHESQAFCLVSYILKYNLSASAGKDLLQLLQTLCPESEYFKKLKYEEMFSNICKNEPEVCNNRFPDDPDIFRCSIGDCPGLRYIGPVSSQTMSNRQPRCFFIIADVESQLRSLTERNNIWDEIHCTENKTIYKC